MKTLLNTAGKSTCYIPKLSDKKTLNFSILIFHDKRPLIPRNSEIEVVLPSQKLCIKDCIQEANTSVWEWSQRENEAIVKFWAFYNFSVELRKQVTKRLHTVCKHCINMHHNMYILQSLFMITNLPHSHVMLRVPCTETSAHWTCPQRWEPKHPCAKISPHSLQVALRHMLNYQVNIHMIKKSNAQDTYVKSTAFIW